MKEFLRVTFELLVFLLIVYLAVYALVNSGTFEEVIPK